MRSVTEKYNGNPRGRGQHKEAGPESTGDCSRGAGSSLVHVTPVATVDTSGPGAGVTKGQKPLLWTLGHVVSVRPHIMLCSQSCHVTMRQGTFMCRCRPQPPATPDFLQEELFRLLYSCGYGPMTAMMCGFWVPMMVRRSYSAGQRSSSLLPLGSPLLPT